MPRNIVICCDGTNNEIAGNQTNVLRLYRMMIRNAEQVTFYDAGVGTNADPTSQWPWRRAIRKHLDGGIGISIRENVLDAYRFLINQYKEGDKIFLFGFSRGAYTVRAVAAMIMRCGLLWPENSHLAEYAWSVFTDEDRSGDARRQFAGPARIKKVFGREINVHFVGVWDTVSSFGWIWDLLTIPNTRENEIISHIRHAVSIDERRSCFQPNLVQPSTEQDCREVWFAGVHADVGGGYSDSEAGLSRIALRWMISEAKLQGLLVDEVREKEQLKKLGDKNQKDEFVMAHDESAKWRWRFISLFPRRGYSISKGHRAWSLWNWARCRNIPDHALVHQSVKARTTNESLKYQPKLPANIQFVDGIIDDQE